MNYIKLSCAVANDVESETLVALLAEHPFEGFETTDKQVDAYVPAHLYDENWVTELIKWIPGLTYHTTLIPPTNWNAAWESSFSPVVIGHFAAVRAHFHQPVQGVAHEIVITPKMSFGTGHHATTAMVMAAMEHISFSGKKVLDFGTGTGVLAILAEKLGAIDILAIDNDEWSINNTLENTGMNACQRITCQLANEVATSIPYDIILANINLNVIKASLTAIHKAAGKDAELLFSGFLKTDEAEMKAQLQQEGFTWQATTQQGDWICIKAHKN
jgi:ribosomal protein L11 methyltransferase